MSWQNGIKTLVPRKFRDAPLVYDYLDGIGEWLDQNAQTKLDGLLNLVDVRTVPTQYLQNLADSIGLTLNQALGSTDADLRHQIENAVDWYKIKGTYKAIKVILYTVQLSANVYDLYTLDYVNFVRMYWFSLGADDPTQFQVYPNTWVNGMYKTPHFDIEIELLLYFGSYPTWNLISGDQFTMAQQLIEQVRPANTVPHYYAKTIAVADTTFLPITQVSSQVTAELIQSNWQQTKYTLDNNPLKYLDQGDIFDFTLTSFLQTWNTFEIGKGNSFVFPCTQGVTVGGQLIYNFTWAGTPLISSNVTVQVAINDGNGNPAGGTWTTLAGNYAFIAPVSGSTYTLSFPANGYPSNMLVRAINNTVTALSSPIFTGTVNSIVVSSNSVIYTCDVPSSFANAQITEMGIFSNNGSILQAIIANPVINKVDGYILRYQVTVNF